MVTNSGATNENADDLEFQVDSIGHACISLYIYNIHIHIDMHIFVYEDNDRTSRHKTLIGP